MSAKVIAYWTTTAILASAIGIGGAAQLAHLQPNVEGVVHILGYPLYFLTIIGVWKVLGAIAILVPRFPLLKEWAYAGIFFDVTGAAASQWAVGDYGAYGFHIIVPLLFALLTIASWKLRPDSRKLQPSTIEPGEYKRSKAIWYWLTTGVEAFILLSGGLWLMSASQFMVNQKPSLGFPAYFWLILGFWKILGGVAILVPRLPLLKEWAYAGIVFNMTGASAARVFIGDSTAHIIAPLVICAIAIVSWMLRPESRKLNPTGIANIDSKEYNGGRRTGTLPA